jgi:hypothetical protein
MTAPNVKVTQFRTFHLLPTPLRRDGVRKTGAYDPMVNNSLANRALRQTVANEFEALGYVDVEWSPEFVVAVYATTHARLDPGIWAYGYLYWPQWWSMTIPDQTLTTFDEGTVVVDVVDPETLELLWRGSARASIGSDPLENAKQVVTIAAAIIDRFPRAKPIVVASKR